MYQLKYASSVLLAVLFCSSYAMADIVVPMKIATDTGTGATIGQVTISESPYGLVFTPNLVGLPMGIHGFHIHQNPSCAPKEKDGKMVAALAAGGHFDPTKSNKHDTPWGDGHLGDLPPLMVDADGHANQAVLAPRLKDLNMIKGHALMIHVGGDNHSDHPLPLGGGGARLACGVIE